MHPSENASDTSDEAAAIQLDGLRRMTPQQRISRMCAMSRHVRDMAMGAIRRRYPDLNEDSVRLMFIELTYGKQLADDIRKWQRSTS